MSVKLMSQVWEADLPPTQKLIMLSLADHANDDGWHVYPSVASICARTNLSERTVRGQLQDLQRVGLLVDTGDRTPRGVVIYAIDTRVLAEFRGAAAAPLAPSWVQQMHPFH